MDLDERRRFVRVPCHNVLEYMMLSRNGRPQADRYGYVHCQNVSLGGILFTSFEEFQKGTPLQLKLHMDCSDRHFANVTMSGKVVRCKKAPQKETWDIAIATRPMGEKEKSFSFFNWLVEKDDQFYLL